MLYFITRRPIKLKIALIGEDTESKNKIREYFAQNNDYEFVLDETDTGLCNISMKTMWTW